MTLKEIKAALIVAHRKGNWERAKILSQEKERLKRAAKPRCVDCGVAIRNTKRNSATGVSVRCYMHHVIHKYYSRAIPNSMKTLACLVLCLIGISANAQFMATTNTATFTWNAVVDPNLSGYQLWYWTGNLTNVHSVPSGQLTERVLNLNWNSTYTAAVKSVVTVFGTNVTSAFSVPVMLVTPPQPILPPAAPTGLTVRGP